VGAIVEVSGVDHTLHSGGYGGPVLEQHSGIGAELLLVVVQLLAALGSLVALQALDGHGAVVVVQRSPTPPTGRSGSPR
jgi:hypothetical protein